MVNTPNEPFFQRTAKASLAASFGPATVFSYERRYFGNFSSLPNAVRLRKSRRGSSQGARFERLPVAAML
jgi:hypothetical protein